VSSTGHGPRPEDREDDPTGVRELLSALPDPGPVPEDLAARISASLDDLDQERRPRRPRHWLPAAVAVMAVAVVSVVVFDGGGGVGEAPEVAAQSVPTTTQNADESSAEAIAADVSSSSEESLEQLDEGTFASGAEAVLKGAYAGTAPAALPSAFDVIDGEVRALPPRETENCVQAAGERAEGSGWVAAPATVAQTDVVVVSDRDAPDRRAWALHPDCVADSSAPVLHGPTDLP